MTSKRYRIRRRRKVGDRIVYRGKPYEITGIMGEAVFQVSWVNEETGNACGPAVTVTLPPMVEDTTDVRPYPFEEL